MAPNMQTAELLRRNKASFSDMEIVRRKPFAKLIEPNLGGFRMPDGTAHNSLRLMNDVAINYEFYPNNKGILAPQVIFELVERAKKKGPVHFLDMGPGLGKGLEMAEKIAPNVNAHALGLNYPERHSYIPRGKWIRRHFEATVVKCATNKGDKRTVSDEGFFHVIQSHYGISQAANVPAALENALNSLRFGGKLFFEAKESLSKSKLMEVLKKQGFDVVTLPNMFGFNMHAIVRQKDAIADLSEYYKFNQPFKVPIDMPAMAKSRIKR